MTSVSSWNGDYLSSWNYLNEDYFDEHWGHTNSVPIDSETAAKIILSLKNRNQEEEPPFVREILDEIEEFSGVQELVFVPTEWSNPLQELVNRADALRETIHFREIPNPLRKDDIRWQLFTTLIPNSISCHVADESESHLVGSGCHRGACGPLERQSGQSAQTRGQAADSTPSGPVHHLDLAAGSQPAIALFSPADHADRAVTL